MWSRQLRRRPADGRAAEDCADDTIHRSMSAPSTPRTAEENDSKIVQDIRRLLSGALRALVSVLHAHCITAITVRMRAGTHVEYRSAEVEEANRTSRSNH